LEPCHARRRSRIRLRNKSEVKRDCNLFMKRVDRKETVDLRNRNFWEEAARRPAGAGPAGPEFLVMCSTRRDILIKIEAAEKYSRSF